MGSRRWTPRTKLSVLSLQEKCLVERLYCIEASDIARLREAARRDGERAARVQAFSAYVPLEGPRRRRGHGRRALPHGMDGRRAHEDLDVEE
ncbi:hypothetical protein ACP70R_031450 [Stipagrostis hirtigluma subsp. patula]